MSTRWQRLGARIAAERARRYGTKAAFARAAGLSIGTVDNLEHGRRQSYDPTTVAAVEDALGWTAGSFEKALQGLEPAREDDADWAALREAWPQLPDPVRRALRAAAEEYLRG